MFKNAHPTDAAMAPPGNPDTPQGKRGIGYRLYSARVSSLHIVLQGCSFLVVDNDELLNTSRCSLENGDPVQVEPVGAGCKQMHDNEVIGGHVWVGRPAPAWALRCWTYLAWGMTWLLKLLVLLLAGFIAYCWSGLSPRALIRFDRTGLDPGEPGWGLPIDYTATLLGCVGPAGWIVGLGSFGLAFMMAWVIYRWPWPLRVIVAAAPPALVVYLAAYVWDLRAEVRPVCLQIGTAEVALAMLAAVLCRRIARVVQRMYRDEEW